MIKIFRRISPQCKGGFSFLTRQNFSIPVVVQLFPVMLVLGGLFLGSLGFAVAQSLGYAPWYGINTFPSLTYYQKLMADNYFWVSVGLTFYYAIVATVLSLAFGTILAVILVKNFPYKNVYKYIYKLPMMVPYSVGIALAVLMMSNTGIVSRLMWSLGVIERPNDFIPLLKTYYGWGIIAVYVWKQLPFVTISIYAVLLGIGRDTADAAAVLGAGRITIFFRVTLPQVMPGIITASLICFAFNVGAFEAPYILGAGFPETLPVMAWRFFNDANVEMRLMAMATVVILTIFVSLVLYLYVLAYGAYERKIGGFNHV